MTNSIYTLEHLIEKKEINLTQEVFKATNNIVKFFQRILGLLGVLIALSVLVLPVFLFGIITITYFKNAAKSLAKIKEEAFTEVIKLSYEDLLDLEKSLNSSLEKFTDLKRELLSLKNLIFFKSLYISINSMCMDLEEINKVIISTYTYSEDELTEEEIKAANDYWNNVKMKNPKLVELLDKDNSSNKVIFQSKKLQNDLC